jgi:hypothetical protein
MKLHDTISQKAVIFKQHKGEETSPQKTGIFLITVLHEVTFNERNKPAVPV